MFSDFALYITILTIFKFPNGQMSFKMTHATIEPIYLVSLPYTPLIVTVTGVCKAEHSKTTTSRSTACVPSLKSADLAEGQDPLLVYPLSM